MGTKNQEQLSLLRAGTARAPANRVYAVLWVGYLEF
jgi:hypothetical protein